MGSILIEGLHFHYDSPFKGIFQDLSLVLDTDWRIGLIGRNGRGKTTLLRLLHGELQTSRGSVKLASREDIEQVILDQQPTMVFVEHDRSFVERIATAVLELG